MKQVDQEMVAGLPAVLQTIFNDLATRATDDELAAAIAAIPAGYTVERGVDPTNGEWEKHPSGLLICRKLITLGGTSTLAAPLNATGAVAWTFAVPFVGIIPTVTASGSAHLYGTTSVSLTAASVRGLYVSSTTTGPVLAHATATGRWK